MDIKHKEIWMRVKLPGQSEMTMIHEESIIKGLQELMRQLAAAPNRYGALTIDLDFNPLDKHVTKQEASLAELMAGIDPALFEDEIPEQTELWDSSPLNPESSAYDPLYVSWFQCGVASTRETKTAEDLKILRNHVESKYEGTRWWDGAHRW